MAAVQGVQALPGDLGVGATLAPSPSSGADFHARLAAPVGASEEATAGNRVVVCSERPSSTPEPTLRLVQAEDSEAAVQELDTIVEDDDVHGDTSTEADDETTPRKPDEPP